MGEWKAEAGGTRLRRGYDAKRNERRREKLKGEEKRESERRDGDEGAHRMRDGPADLPS